MYRLRPRKPRLWYTRLGSYYAVYVVRGSRLGPLVRVATVNGYRLDFSQYPRLESYEAAYYRSLHDIPDRITASRSRAKAGPTVTRTPGCGAGPGRGGRAASFERPLGSFRSIRSDVTDSSRTIRIRHTGDVDRGTWTCRC